MRTALAALGIIGCYAVAGVIETQVPPTSDQTISDDDPRFDCYTMGNRICGDYIQLKP